MLYLYSLKHELCYALEHYVPKATDIYIGEITDYLGNTTRVQQYEAVALYDSSRNLGDTTKKTNLDNVRYLRKHGLDVDTTEKWLQVVDGKPQIATVDGVMIGVE